MYSFGVTFPDTSNTVRTNGVAASFRVAVRTLVISGFDAACEDTSGARHRSARSGSIKSFLNTFIFSFATINSSIIP
jgi:hypothetical protein